MSTEHEREMRTADVGHETHCSKCYGCGRDIVLWFNGGELDSRECCGYSYSLEHVRIDFVVIAPESASVSLQEDNQ